MSFEKFIQECKYLLYEFDESSVLEQPPKGINADLAFPCFSLAKEQKRNPNIIAEELEHKIREKIKPNSLVKDVKSLGPYLNFYINNEKFSELLLKDVIKQGKKYGSKKKTKQKFMLEYCHANTHKAFHVGHTRNICTGECIARILENEGIKVIRTNYQGDIGMHVAKTLWGYMNLKKLGLKEPKKDKGKWLGIVYAKASAASQDEKIKEEINKINQLLYKDDKKLLALWKKTRKLSIDYFEHVVYPDFGVKFDRFYFESEVEKKGILIAKDLLKKDIAKLSDGAIIMNFEQDGMGIFILLKSDGTPLYSTKDLYLAELQNKEYKPNMILHIVGSEQNLYFEQLFKTLQKYNPKLAMKEKHISYELVILPTGKMASREGKVVLYDDTLQKLIDMIKEKIKKSGKKLPKKELEQRAKKIALGAIKYTILSQDTKKTIVFNEDEILSFEGDTGPYLQYTYARANSIIKKAKKKPKTGKLTGEKEFALAKKLSQFSETIKRAAHDYKPHYVASYLFELATIFNEYYHETKVIGSENESAKLALVKSVTIVLENGLKLLGIDAPKEM
jgi:arginyl-tRNA synthetase